MERIGIGYDVHRFGGGGPLWIGGVEVPFHTGLSGHSDADVLLHAICDAMLGAAALPDIGQQFPPDDPAYEDISSRVLLAHTRKFISDAGFAVYNVDSVIICEKPRMAEHIPAMRKAIAETLIIAENLVGVKATTTEGLGFTGRAEGIAAQAVVLLKKIQDEY